MNKKNILIVGGGAGGLELAARLSRSKFNHRLFEITLVDCKLKHVWKPLLHEVATGTLLTNEDEVDYLSYASGKFKWEYGSIKSIDRQQKEIVIDPVIDEAGLEILPKRILQYDYLILAFGSISNDFSIPGVKENCVFLDNLQQAETLNKLFIQHIIQLLSGDKSKSALKIAIIGGGATGVELAAEIQYALSEANKLKKNITNYNLQISVIESADRILPQLPERISKAVANYLQKIGVTVITNEFVNKVTSGCVHTKNGKEFKADLLIWAAGVKVESIVKNFDLEINSINQLCITDTLQTTKDPNIFAFGDCSNLLQKMRNGKVISVPPKAQAAHQQAKLLAKSLIRILQGGTALTYYYKDYGSLITVSKYETFGSLMNRISRSIYIEGTIARMSYWLLYKNHQVILWGFGRVLLMTIANFISKRVRPKLKLH